MDSKTSELPSTERRVDGLQNFAPTLSTKRLVLTPICAADAPDVYEAITASIDILRRFPASLPWAVAEPSLERAASFCAAMEAAIGSRQDLVYVARLATPGRELVGMLGLHKIDQSVPKCDIGFWGTRTFHRQGYLSEAVTALQHHAETTLCMRRIQALCDSANQAALGLCIRCGLEPEGTLVNDRRDPVDGSLRSMVVLSRTSNDPPAAR